MNDSFPRIRLYSTGGHLTGHEGLSIVFYLRFPHAHIFQNIMRAMEVYLRAVGPKALSAYNDGKGEWQRLDTSGWAFVHQKLHHPRICRLTLISTSPQSYDYRIFYHGLSFKPFPWEKDASNHVSTVSFWLPTTCISKSGPDQVRGLALELARELPFCSGLAGLSFNGESDPLNGYQETRELCFRYPGLDIPRSLLSLALGTRLSGVSWLNFLGPDVLNALGGVAQIQQRLHSPETTVQALDAEHALVSLSPSPQAGDTLQGDFLPAYREFARLVEPWLHQSAPPPPHLEPQDHVRRWERRFLDP